MSRSVQRPRQLAILLFEDVEVLDFAGPVEVFSVASERVTAGPHSEAVGGVISG